PPVAKRNSKMRGAHGKSGRQEVVDQSEKLERALINLQQRCRTRFTVRTPTDSSSAISMSVRQSSAKSNARADSLATRYPLAPDHLREHFSFRSRWVDHVPLCHNHPGTHFALHGTH